jgi:hypothetical protein
MEKPVNNLYITEAMLGGRILIVSGLLLAVSIGIGGCSRNPTNSSKAPPPTGKPVAISDGSNTWHLGAVIIDGTNVSDTNITVGIRAREASK